MAYPYYPQPNYYPSVYQPIQQPTAPQTGTNWISGDLEAQMYPVAPNNAVTLWSQTEPVVYMKQADATGRPILKSYDLVERNAAESSLVERTDGKSDEFVRKDDLVSVKESVEALRAEIDLIKSDMYGIAGKKRVKKNDADDE